MVVRTRFAELMLPVLLLPFLLLPLTYAVQATARLLAGRPLSEVSGWLKLLAAYDLVFVAVAVVLFSHTGDEWGSRRRGAAACWPGGQCSAGGTAGGVGWRRWR